MRGGRYINGIKHKWAITKIKSFEFIIYIRIQSVTPTVTVGFLEKHFSPIPLIRFARISFFPIDIHP